MFSQRLAYLKKIAERAVPVFLTGERVNVDAIVVAGCGGLKQEPRCVSKARKFN